MPVVGRLRPGVTTAAAGAEARLLQSRLPALFPWPMPADWNADVDAVSLQSRLVGDVRTRLLLFARLDAARKAELLRACEERARAVGAEVVQARIGCAESRRRVEVYNSEGRTTADDRTRVRLSARSWHGATGAWRRAPTRAAAMQGFELVRHQTPSRSPSRPRAGR